jgi:D-alanyl-D-alanine carboxypeptidase (penicillin-binding protein 5/6)
MSKELKIFFISLFLSIPFWWGVNSFNEKLENYILAQVSAPVENIIFVPLKRKPPPSLNVKSAISVKTDIENFEKILFKKEEKITLPIASLTKLMTALVVFEEGYDLNEKVLISKQAADQEDVPVFGNLKEGESFKVEELLELSLVYSSNDAAFALSQKIPNFVEKMNNLAQKLGMENTHFSNPTGLDSNFSAAQDLVKLAKYILKNYPQIFEISKRPPKYKLDNGIYSLFLPKEIIGGKTGYTPEAGGCLLLIFRDEKEPDIFYINVILGAESIQGRVEEMQKLVDWILS